MRSGPGALFLSFLVTPIGPLVGGVRSKILCVTTNGNPMSYKRPTLYKKYGFEKGPIIESGCQLAVHVIILPRIRVGHESIIVANSLVVKDVEPLSIMVGSPAKMRGTVQDLHRLPLEIRNEIGLN